MRVFKYFVAFFLCGMVFAKEEIDIFKSLHIEELMPRKGQSVFLGVEPAIPRDYVALSKSGEINYFSDWVYWGPKDAIESYFKDKATLSVPILQIDFTPNYSQKQRGSLNIPWMRKELENHMKNFKLESGNWGKYPYCTISGEVEGKELNMAYVGLNDDSGAVLFFNLVIPNIPDGKAIALKFWDNFFKNTKELDQPLWIRVVSGQTMEKGYTQVNVLGRKIKVTAQRRKSDKKLLIAAFSEDGSVSYQYKNTVITPMLFEWHYGEPLAKIEGTFVVDSGWANYHMITSVFIEEVDAFTSISKEKGNIFIKEIESK